MRKTVYLMISLLITAATFAKDFEEDNIFLSASRDKVAILMVHFGTTHADTRAKTIDLMTEQVRNSYPDIEVREAYSSRIVIKRLADRFGIAKLNPLQALMQLYLDGYTHIIVQSTTLIDGAEMLSVRKDVEQMESYFEDVRIGQPLLYTKEDYENLIRILTEGTDDKKAYVWVGHGTSYASTSQYAMLGYMLDIMGIKNSFVGTIEGYPTLDEVLQQLNKNSYKQVELLPLMYVAGEHAKNDMAEDWKEALEEQGYEVSLRMQGLGELSEVRQQVLDHLNFAATHRHLEIMKKKNLYRTTGKKLKATE